MDGERRPARRPLTQQNAAMVAEVDAPGLRREARAAADA
jgi:hypothetical protein